MRLWSKQIISVLPREQLVAQWRELSACAGNIKLKDTPNHILVNKIMDYPLDHFISYAYYIRQEMTNRGYKTMDSVWNKIVRLKPNWELIFITNIYPYWMDITYLKICYWNLYEKYLCGGVSKEDWIKIDKVSSTYFCKDIKE